MPKPSSSTSDETTDRSNGHGTDGARPSAAPTDAGLGRGRLFGFQERGGAVDAVADSSWLAAMLDFEAALARAEARAGIVLPEDAEAIAACCRPELFDVATIAEAAARDGVPAIALVRELTRVVRDSAGERAAGQVHRGATSQDVMDTAAMLVTRRALAEILDDLAAAAAAATQLAAAYRTTPMAGRTWLQQALPTTFGLVAATWLVSMDRAGERLAEVAALLPAQLGGAAGTLASLGHDGLAVRAYLAELLGLGAPAVPWHADRTPVLEIAAVLGEAAAVAAKVGLDVTLLASTEIGEVSERGEGGGSSTMPQKRNPVAAVTARAVAARAPGLVSTLLAASPGELQRAAGGWQAEWWALSGLIVASGSAVSWLRECLERLDVDPERMRANLELTGGLVLAEHVVTALQPALGRVEAHREVEAAAGEARESRRPFADALAARPLVAAQLEMSEIAALLDPAGYLGSAGDLVDRALSEHGALAWWRAGGPAR